MAEREEQPLEGELRPRFRGFHDLMPRKVQEILLVASLYDSFILEEDGRLTDRIFNDYVGLHLSYPPRVTRVSSGRRALALLRERRFDLVVTMLRLPDLEVEEFVASLREAWPHLPVALLTWDADGLARRRLALRRAGLDRAFLWAGDTGIFLALVKSIEDRLNLEHDVRHGDVRILVVVEDSVHSYSLLLPLLYQEIMSLTRSLMDQGLNDLEKLFRMRARPKLLLVHTLEEALAPLARFPHNVLGYLSDVRFLAGGEEDPGAGFRLLREVRARVPDIPVLLLSAEPENAARAAAEGTAFLDKNDPQLLTRLSQLLKEAMGFGAFLFRAAGGQVVATAGDLRELARAVRSIPDEVLVHHSRRNHFSHWLAARGEFALAGAIRPWRVEDFRDVAALRLYLAEHIERSREEIQRGVIADLSGPAYDPGRMFTRLGSGSLGGKARGIAFLAALMERAGLEAEFPEVRIRVPRTLALGAHIFERFVAENGLSHLADAGLPDGELAGRFAAGRLPAEVETLLRAALAELESPLAVRSSSLLEDSPDQPFAGVFSTFMLPNNHPSLERRLAQLTRAVKLVFASTWLQAARRYLRATGHEPARERMGVAIQELVGLQREGWFYPCLSGVAQTHNFYPTGYITPDDGAATVALGLGKTVVEGGNALRFCPRHPQVLPQLADLETVLDATQRTFWALDLSDPEVEVAIDSDAPLRRLDLEVAERHGVLRHLASVLSREDDRLRDGLSSDGPRVVTFAPLLKWRLLPLAEVLSRLLLRVQQAMAGPAEIEFAALLPEPAVGRLGEVHLLQVRPLTAAETREEVVFDESDEGRVVVATTRALGHGRLETLQDVVYVRPGRFDRLATGKIVPEVERCNDLLQAEGRPYLLLGPGRWGTADPFLGVPVTWDQVSGARVLVEADLPGFEVEPSQGSHFFHNVTAFGVFLLTVSLHKPGERVEWAWLEGLPARWEGSFVRHLRLAAPLRVVLDGHSGRGVVIRPG